MTTLTPSPAKRGRPLHALAWLVVTAGLATAATAACSSESPPASVFPADGGSTNGEPPRVASPWPDVELGPGETRRLCPSSRQPDGSWVVVEGIDVSDWEVTDWDEVVRRNPNMKWAIARVSAGISRLDYRFKTDWPGMKRVGLVRGAYQYLRPRQNAKEQADLFLRRMEEEGGLDAEDLPPVLDFETTDDMPTATVICRAQIWLARVARATRRIPIIYASAQYAEIIPADFGRYPLWVANYVETPSRTCPNTPGAWAKWRMWQWSETGSVRGVYENADHDDKGGGTIRMANGSPVIADCDMNYFDGTLAELRSFIASTVHSGDVADPPSLATRPVVDGDIDCSDGCCTSNR